MSEQMKGIDDVLAAQGGGLHKIKVLDGDAAWQFIDECVRVTGATVQCERPTIDTDQPMKKVVELAVGALACHPDIYARDSVIALVTRGASAKIEPVKIALLRVFLNDSARYTKRGRGGKELRAEPKHDIVAAVAAWPDLRTFRAIKGIVACPILRLDGTLHRAQGYDPSTQLYADVASDLRTKVPPAPTRKDAKRALRRLKHLVDDFPLVDEAHRAVWLALVLTLAGRHLIDGNVPFFLFTGNQPGVGKGKLADLAGLIVEGRAPDPMSALSRNHEEDRKRIMAVARDGRLFALIDNIAGVLGSPAFDAALTGRSVSDRVIGSADLASVSVRTVWAGTGNNVQISGDLGRRCVFARLETNRERPEEREDFRHTDILGHVTAHRGRYLSAALTILSAYLHAGTPRQSMEAFGSFEPWSRLVRGALLWAGGADPCATRAELRATADPAEEALRTALKGLRRLGKAHGGTFSAAELQAAWRAEELLPHKQREYSALWLALDELLPDRGATQTVPGTKPLGKLLRRHSKRVAGGRRLTLVEGRKGPNGNRWQVERVPSFVSTTERPTKPDSSKMRPGRSDAQERRK